MFYENILSNYIEANYDNIKTLLKKEWFKMKHKNFDEDIFHNTLIKCMDKFNSTMFNENEFMAYLVSSFKMNVIREENYFINSTKDNKDVNTIKKEIFDNSNIDYNNLLIDICENFNKEYTNIFQDWLDGCTIKELNQLYNKKNCRYIIDKIRKYILENYTREEFI